MARCTLPFIASRWYWIVGGDETQVYSSAHGAYIPADSDEVTSWIASGGRPSKIISVAELNEVLSTRGLPTIAS